MHQPAMQQQANGDQNDDMDLDNADEQAGDEWPAWNPMVFAVDNGQ